MNHNAAEESYFQWIRFAVGQSETCPSAEGVDWKRLYTFSVQQAIAGVMFEAISKSGVKIPREVLLPWFALSEQIKKRNRLLNQRCVELTELLRKDGFESCILKGQGNALTYPAPYSRTPGDIDVWMMASPKKVISYVRRVMPKSKACYHHIEYPPFGGVTVEMHYKPSFLNNLTDNWRLQRWFRQVANEQFKHHLTLGNGEEVSVPTNSFNRIFQMAHILNHVIYEGIGLRQLMDYYFLLKQGFTETEQRHDERLLKQFGLYGMARAVMYVLQTVFGLEDKYLLVPVDERKGQFLLDEILLAGNFGRYDERVKQQQSQLAHNIERIKRDVRLVRFFPSEALCEPVFRTWHFFWRLAH